MLIFSFNGFPPGPLCMEASEEARSLPFFTPEFDTFEPERSLPLLRSVIFLLKRLFKKNKKQLSFDPPSRYYFAV